jgi:hypothetical protein
MKSFIQQGEKQMPLAKEEKKTKSKKKSIRAIGKQQANIPNRFCAPQLRAEAARQPQPATLSIENHASPRLLVPPASVAGDKAGEARAADLVTPSPVPPGGPGLVVAPPALLVVAFLVCFLTATIVGEPGFRFGADLAGGQGPVQRSSWLKDS